MHIPVAEWTERSVKRGLDPLGMQTSSIRLYQSLVPGISNITLRLRYYALYPWLCRTYAKRVGHTDPAQWRVFLRRAEAFYALVACRAESANGVAGITWAQRVLDADGDRIDIANAADPDGSDSYLKRAAFDAAYRTQLFETGVLESSTQHDIPLPSCRGEAMAEAFDEALGDVSDLIYESIDRGWVTREELDQAAVAVPSGVPRSGKETDLYRLLLLQGDEARSRTITFVLAVARLLEREPTAEDFRWVLYAGADSAGRPLLLDNSIGMHTADAIVAHRDLWWVYQANDLCHVAYETLLKYMLDVLAEYPNGVLPARLVDLCADRVMAELEHRTWAALVDSAIPAKNAYDAEDPTSEFALGSQAMRAGRDHRRLCGPEQGVAAIRLLATLERRLQDENHNLSIALGSFSDPFFRSLLTERGFLRNRRDEALQTTVGALLGERVLGRHLWVALRKLRYQNDYTYLVEVDDGLVRLREADGPIYTTPRIGPAITFLKDCHLIDANGLTDQGIAALFG